MAILGVLVAIGAVAGLVIGLGDRSRSPLGQVAPGTSTPADKGPLGGGTTSGQASGGPTSGTASGGAGVNTSRPRVSLSVYSGPGQLEVTFGSKAAGEFSIAMDGQTVQPRVRPGEQIVLPGVPLGVHTVTLLVRDHIGTHQLSRQAEAYGTDTVYECVSTKGAGGDYSYVNVNQPKCANPPAATAAGGVNFHVPTPDADTVPGTQPVYEFLGSSPQGQETNKLTLSSTPPSSAGGWTWKLVSREWVAAPQPLPGLPVQLQEWRDATGQYRYIPTADEPPKPYGSAWTPTGFSLYVCP